MGIADALGLRVHWWWWSLSCRAGEPAFAWHRSLQFSASIPPRAHFRFHVSMLMPMCPYVYPCVHVSAAPGHRHPRVLLVHCHGRPDEA
ncbi:hypothetical protein EDB81DRAFT_804779 [Dactylonectria macrodidyma]|uniref:Uncharacterized protein n=1 Tax=Dactylonectria macrodidyma TaxID=307937 RepID=A0A9P9IU86_9HYPO|nr:hypothetical protein EDB81DRAFT_804779 [Dactylonectria macrodidyma]